MIEKDLGDILGELEREFRGILGDQLEAIYLYGSRARGDASADSDIDVLIVLKDDFDYFQVMDLTSEPAWNLSLHNDVVISRVFVSKENFLQAKTPFLLNIRKEAVPV